MELLLKEEVYRIIGAAVEVHKELGHGFLEAVYQEALQIEMEARGVKFESQKPLKISYKERVLEKEYFADLLCFDKIIVELKAVKQLSDMEYAQLINYLKATGLEVGLLINFGSRGKLEWKRIVLTHKK